MKPENVAKSLQLANKGFVIAPAGYGKTHLIAETVVNFGKDKELILTHTHAGVDSIRRKVLSLKPSRKNYHIETIDGFILRYVLNYPQTSSWHYGLDNIDWPEIRNCGIKLFKKEFIKKVLKNSYSGIYIDEYQDCCIEQHFIAMEIATILPLRILGDPLQGIFDFGINKIVDWKNDVENNFSLIKVLKKPWRWDNANNTELGSWLCNVRTRILNGDGIELQKLPSCVHHINTNSETDIIKVCYRIMSNIDSGDSIVIIGKALPIQRTHYIASKLRGNYGVIEPIDSNDLKKIILKLNNKCIYKRTIAVLDLARTCFSGVTKTRLKCEYEALKKKKTPKRRTSLVITPHLNQHLLKKDLLSLVSLLESFTNIGKCYLYRKELFWVVVKIIRESINSKNPLEESMIKVRENTRRLGRKLPKKVIGRTLLIKGLEFDHAIIVEADSFTMKNLYVALTRASKTITIISNGTDLLKK